MGILTKSAILNGAKEIEKVELKSAGGEIYLRHLTQGEWNKIDEIEAKALGTFRTNEKARRGRKLKQSQFESQLESQGEIDVLRTTQASNDAMAQAIYFSINNEKNKDEWELDEILEIDRKLFNELYDIIRKMSGVDEESEIEKEVDSFPEN